MFWIALTLMKVGLRLLVTRNYSRVHDRTSVLELELIWNPSNICNALELLYWERRWRLDWTCGLVAQWWRLGSGSARKVQAVGEDDPAVDWEEQLRSGCDLEDVWRRGIEACWWKRRLLIIKVEDHMRIAEKAIPQDHRFDSRGFLEIQGAFRKGLSRSVWCNNWLSGTFIVVWSNM